MYQKSFLLKDCHWCRGGETSGRSSVYRPESGDPIGASGNKKIIKFCNLKCFQVNEPEKRVLFD